MLTDEQIQDLASKHTGSCEYPTRYVMNSNSFAKAVEAPLLARIAEMEAGLEARLQGCEAMSDTIASLERKIAQLEQAAQPAAWMLKMKGG